MEDEIKKAERLNAIVDAVCYWLGYQFKIGRDQLIHEASLRYPIADTITAKGIAINRVILEKLHPIFKKKYIDLVIFDETVKEPATEKDDKKLKEVYEFKVAKNDTSKEYKDEHQRVFNDINRLAYYHLWSNKDCYFLMCGKYEDFKTYFVGQKSEIKKEKNKLIAPVRKITTVQQGHALTNTEQPDQEKVWKPEGTYKDWFGFQIEEVKEIEFNKTDNTKFGLKPFQANYKVRKTQTHKYSETLKIKTKCVAITPSGLENIKTHAAGIWKIEAVKETTNE
ncbi:MAG: hypothetical protein WCM76_12025 [Bacteroidota bacterium]